MTSFTLHSYGQTAKEILTRMETVFETQGGGIEMIVDSKLPLLGRNVSKTYSLGGQSENGDQDDGSGVHNME